MRVARPGFALDVDLALPARGVTRAVRPVGLAARPRCCAASPGLERADSGRVRGQRRGLAGRRARRLRARRTGARWAMCSRRPACSRTWTCARNLEYGLQARAGRASAASRWSRRSSCWASAHLLARRPGTLSGGERQRVAHRARAGHQPAPAADGRAAGLARRRSARREILPCLERLHDELDIPVLYVTHAPDEVARLADHLVVLDAGRVTATGPAARTADAARPAAGARRRRRRADRGHGQRHRPGLAPDAGRTSPAAGSACPTSGSQLGPARAPAHPGARREPDACSARTGTSVLNILPATVTDLADDSPGQVMVGLDAGGSALLARITRKSADALQLAPGRRCMRRSRAWRCWAEPVILTADAIKNIASGG